MKYLALVGIITSVISAILNYHVDNMQAFYGWLAAGIWAFNSFIQELNNEL